MQNNEEGQGLGNPRISSFASLFDTDDGSELKFIHVVNVNGVNCAKLEKKVLQSEIKYCNFIALCCLLGANPPYEVIYGYVHLIWKHLTIDKGVMVKKVLLVVRFNKIEDRDMVINKGIYFLDKKPFLVKPWNENMYIDMASITSLPVWI